MSILIVGVKSGVRYRLPLEEQKSPCTVRPYRGVENTICYFTCYESSWSLLTSGWVRVSPQFSPTVGYSPLAVVSPG